LDLATITLSSIAGAVLWEFLKPFIANLAKRQGEARATTQKMLRDDMDLIVKLVCEVLELSVSYFATPFESDKAQDYSRQIKARTKTAGLKISALNLTLAQSKKDQIDISLWTRFKEACTKELDVRRADAWKEDDPRLNDIYKAAHHLHASLSNARYASV